jgi:hypothetical protein
MNEITPSTGSRSGPVVRPAQGDDAFINDDATATAPWVPPLPSVKDWALLAISTVFVAIGLVVLWSEPDVGIVTLALFGSCLALFAHNIWRKFHYRNLAGARIAVVGGVPIRAGLARPIGLGLWIATMGGLMAGFGGNYGPVFQWLSAGVALAGFAVLGLVALGRYSGRFLRFDPEGLTIAERGWQVLLPWDSITDVQVGSYNDNPMLFLHVADPGALVVAPPEAGGKAMAKFASNQSWMGAPFAIMTGEFGTDAPVLAGAIATYVQNHAARRSLTPALPGKP